MVIDLQIFVNYPETKKGEELLIDHLATFKAKLLLKSIEDLNVDDKTKEKILEKVLKALNNIHKS